MLELCLPLPSMPHPALAFPLALCCGCKWFWAGALSLLRISMLFPRAEACAKAPVSSQGSRAPPAPCHTRWMGRFCSPFLRAVTVCGPSLAYSLPGNIYGETVSAFAAEQCRSPPLLCPAQPSSHGGAACEVCEVHTLLAVLNTSVFICFCYAVRYCIAAPFPFYL